MDRSGLAAFLRARRAALRPEDAGMPRGSRRRTPGLRREEVAVLCDMSADYYTRLEQPQGPVPSESMLTSLARGLRLSLEERDHLFRLAGYAVPPRATRGDHVNPGMMRILDKLEDTPALVMNDLTETLRQTRPAVALFGDETVHIGLARSKAYRWFTDPDARRLYPVEDHARHSRCIVGTVRMAYTRQGKASRAATLVGELLLASEEFAGLWDQHVVVGPYYEPKRILHPRVGPMEIQGQTLVDPDQSQSLLVITAVPGSESHDKLELLRVIGNAI
ncbi:helix-turn-helix transcriptional regulator [Streptomyces sp. NPDC101225]|uniref:helix-turn-helix transcriptional regulator n=1 Tax=Streptomyces sp. NPDC101225 TaxID=3366135 RepID=UPI00381920BD